MTRREALLWIAVYLLIAAGLVLLAIWLFATNVPWALHGNG